MTESSTSSRRDFMADIGRIASAVALTGGVVAATPAHAVGQSATPAGATGAWDLSWVDRLTGATDRAVFDWPTLGDPADPAVLELAERCLDNCKAAYESRAYTARVVLNIRTQAVPAALVDAAWARYALGEQYNTKDPNTQQPATVNPFWHRGPSPGPGLVLPTLADMVQRGAIVLVCDFALGHLSNRLATKLGRDKEEVHRDLLGSLVPNAFAVPSGIFGLAKSQNSGCAYVRM